MAGRNPGRQAFRGGSRACPAGRAAAPPLPSVVGIPAFAAGFRLLLGGDGVAALEPAAEVDIRAALGAEGLEPRLLRLAADGAAAPTLRRRFRHRSPRG